VVPITGTGGVGALHPALSAGPSGLTKTSYALVDHLRSIDKRGSGASSDRSRQPDSRVSTRDSSYFSG
jgi:hypothetical protein